jgi:JAB1/Mov34/MPN/PAD-1 ubiquitin protease
MEQSKQSQSGLEFKLHPVSTQHLCLVHLAKLPGTVTAQMRDDSFLLLLSIPVVCIAQISICDVLTWLVLQLVLINLSDHHTRVASNIGGSQPVLGCLLGSQSGRTVDISNSFEIKYQLVDGQVQIDTAFLLRKQEQCKQPPPC